MMYTTRSAHSGKCGDGRSSCFADNKPIVKPVGNGSTMIHGQKWFPCPIVIFRSLSLFLLVSFLRRFSPWLFVWNYHLSFVPSMICHFTKNIWVCLKKRVYPQICDLVVMNKKNRVPYFQTNPYFISVPITGCLPGERWALCNSGRYGRLGEQWRGSDWSSESPGDSFVSAHMNITHIYIYIFIN
jgi:hypothetical protein